ncbi:NmrA family NAD(P)-binding protein [Nodosilinea sp. LEGE 07298]|uniref:NmrA family NAD(P)-binding protein n=1 Tax=Nodosilinea sp. LEGE 07298 TaxID=2777970 RepID=UPI001880B6FC|nr:NmrA family NAD(P)-binding protein [Nodosilinea sp. LEGE 07298]MBE9111199.1 NmrA family NAD(P)-binding protein [Nodosilinea sp. LEGE 07298]
MKNPTILVTGATGKTGGAVAMQLLAKGYAVRALVRSRDKRSEQLYRMGAEIAVADLFDPEQLTQALQGTQRAYYLPIIHPYMIQSATAFAIAAGEAKLEAIVQISQWTSSLSHPSLHTRQIWLVDQLFANIPGVAHTIVNPGMFADNFLRVVDFASLLGFFPILMGKSRSAPVANEDIARVAVAVLLDPERHDGKRYRPSGSQLLSGYDMAAIVQKVLGKRVLPVEMPMWLFYKVAQQQGVDPFLISSLRYYVEDNKMGTFSWNGGTSDAILELTGEPAEDFETTVRRYLAMPFAKPTMTNRLRALVNFLMIPFYPGYNPERYDRRMRFPMPTQPKFCLSSERWRAEHSPQVAVLSDRKV